MWKPSFLPQTALAAAASGSISTTTTTSDFRRNGSHYDSVLALRGGGGGGGGETSPFDPLMRKFLPSNEQFANVILALLLATLLKPAAKMYYEDLSSMIRDKIQSITTHLGGGAEPSAKPQDNDADKKEEKEETAPRTPYKDSKFYRVVQTLVEAAQLVLVVATFDLSKTLLECCGVRFPKSEHLTDVFLWGVFLVWGSRKVGVFKFYLLKKVMKNTDLINDLRRLAFINRLTDYGLIFFGIFAFYEVLNVEMGYSAKSLLATWSVGTAAIALATKEIITNFLNGIILSASDRIFVGDSIQIQGDIKTVNKLGWLETKLRGSDNILYTVPNTELVNTKLSNLSRVNTCQVHQTLKFPYSSLELLPKVTQDIKSEIRAACPSIITDGSKPFQCYWQNYSKDGLEVFVNAHFRIPPVGNAYYENKQECLLAIDRAIRKNGIENYTGG